MVYLSPFLRHLPAMLALSFCVPHICLTCIGGYEEVGLTGTSESFDNGMSSSSFKSRSLCTSSLSWVKLLEHSGFFT